MGKLQSNIPRVTTDTIMSNTRKTVLMFVFLLVTQAYSDKVKKNPSAPNRSRRS